MVALFRSILAAFLLAVALGDARGAERSKSTAPEKHWSFQKLVRPDLPAVKQAQLVKTPIDAFLLSALEKKGLSFAPPADRATLLRRLTFDLIGLPPRPEDIQEFVADPRPDAYRRVVERLLASPHYGERWGKYWLDVAGYADSNGYFNADSVRPWAYRYRDYVIRSFNADKPFDQFVQEQLAGDELSGYRSGHPVTPRIAELFTATHFLRNGQDGTSESDGNPDERRVDRASALQGTLQITMNALLGITIQCCRCHEHKFEPIRHAEYYSLQSIFYPAFPAYDADKWIAPKNRVREMASGAELADWQQRTRSIELDRSAARREFAAWVEAHRPPEAVLFRDDFAEGKRLAERWSNKAPGERSPGLSPAVAIDSSAAPGAIVKNGALEIIESGAPGDRWLLTRGDFDWTPEGEGEWIQATFDLVADKVHGSAAAERIGFFIAAREANAGGPRRGGNVLVDANPAGGAAVHLDYPGSRAKIVGEIGTSGCRPGHRYGVRVTNVGGGKYRIEHVVDGLAEKKAVTVEANDLPDGAFGFEYCCGRSFVVDNVLIETSAPGALSKSAERYRSSYRKREKAFRRRLAELEASLSAKPGTLACVTDLVDRPAPMHVLKRGNYTDLGEVVAPAGLTVLSDGAPALRVSEPYAGSHSTGRRLAFAHWLTEPNSRASSLLARVMANRIWQRHFGTGIVTTADNFGMSGARPTNADLLNHLAAAFRERNWSIKSVHRLIVLSAAYQQSSAAGAAALAADPNNELLGRFPLQRLDAEAVRDAMLSVSGQLSERLYGPYVSTTRADDGSVVVPENQDGADRRGVYLEQRRTQVNTLLELFDAPVMVNNCAVRGTSTVPLQSLALLNSDFVRQRAAAFAARVAGKRKQRRQTAEIIRRTITAAYGRAPTAAEERASAEFLQVQTAAAGKGGGPRQAWNDFCQMLLASNAFLYVE